MDSAAEIKRLTAIGNICRQWSFIEYIYARTIWALLKLDDDTGKIVTGGLDMLPRVNMAINLARLQKRPAAVIECLVSSRRKIQDDFLDQRNAIVHGVYFLSSAGEISVEVHRGSGDRKKS